MLSCLSLQILILHILSSMHCYLSQNCLKVSCLSWNWNGRRLNSLHKESHNAYPAAVEPSGEQEGQGLCRGRLLPLREFFRFVLELMSTMSLQNTTATVCPRQLLEFALKEGRFFENRLLKVFIIFLKLCCRSRLQSDTYLYWLSFGTFYGDLP